MRVTSDIPTFLGRIESVKQDADNSDIRVAIEKAVPLATKQTAKMAKRFRGKTETETAKKIYDYLMQLGYKADGENQNIQLPSSLLKTRLADCKSYSLFTAGILTNLGIPYSFVYTSYNPNQPIPSHVYVVTGNGTIIDAVWGKDKGKFNTEKKPSYRYIRPMNVNYMSGTMQDNGMGRIDLKAAAKKVGLSIPRQIVLGMYSLNLDGIATKAAPKKASLEAGWKKMGGDPAALFRAIRDGASRPPRKVGIFDRLRRKIQELVAKKNIKLAGTGMYGVAEANAAIQALTDGGAISVQYQAALGAIGTAIGGTIGSAIPAIGTAAGAAAGTGIAALLYEMTPTFVNILFNVDASTTTSPAATPTTTTTTDTTMDTDTPLMEKKFPIALVAAGAAALLLITSLNKKK